MSLSLKFWGNKKGCLKSDFVTLSEVEMCARLIGMAFDSAQADIKAIYETASFDFYSPET